MSDYDKLVLTGRLTRNPELRFTPQGDGVCNFTLAVNRFNDVTVWYRVTAWGKVAENCNNYLEKGRMVLIEGQLVPDKETGNPRIWTDNQGQTRASFEVRASTVQFLGGGSGNAERTRDEVGAEDGPIDEDGIPF